MEKLSCVPTAAPENGAHDRPLRQSIMYVWKTLIQWKGIEGKKPKKGNAEAAHRTQR
jgi:hypothetical protein